MQVLAQEIRKEQLSLFGKHIASLRKRQKLSLRKLSERCGIDWRDLQKYEKGEVNMSFLSILEIQRGLAVDLKELMNYPKK